MSDHEWEANGHGFDLLDHTQSTQTQYLYHCEHMDTPRLHVSQIHVVGLVLRRHEQ